MSLPFISICIPAYNSARWLPETLASIRAQTFTDWELVVTEDGTADGTEEIVRAFARTVTQPVRYDRHPQNLGLPATRNSGIAAARAPWVALLDGDDLWTAGHLADLATCARQHPRADFIHAGAVLFDSDTGATLSIRAPTRADVKHYPRSLYVGDYIVQPSATMLKKELWARVAGFNPAFRFVEDREMWLRCARAGAVLLYTGHNTCLYRKHGAALTAQAAPMALACAEVFEQHLDWPVAPAAVRHRLTAEAWTSAGRIVLRTAPRTARKYFARACLVHPTLRPAGYWLVALLLGLRG